jgi:RNA polymerase sigma-70 factor (sigma-E family)
MGADRDEFAAFVVAHEAALLRTAWLLTGDRGRAEDLVRTALARAHRHWRRVRRADVPLASVRRLLVGCHLSRWRRWRGEQVLTELPDVPADGRPDALEAALALLSLRARAVLVLRFHEDLTEAETARVLRCPTGAVRTHTALGLATVRAALRPGTAPPGGREPVVTGPDLDDQDVRDALHRLAARAAPPRGADTADAAIALSRRQRRTRAAWAGGAVLLAVLAGAVPAVLPDAGPVPGRVATDPDPTPQAAPALSDLPTRGSLAGDDGFVAGVAALEWSAPLGLNGAGLTPPAGTRQVLFAGDLPGGRRWALVVGSDEGQGVAAWFGGPAGAAPAELTALAPPERFTRGAIASLLDTTGPAPVLVVVAEPGDRVRWSPGTVRLPDGSTGHAWTDLTGSDGVLVAEVAAPSVAGSGTIELVRGGSFPTVLPGTTLTDASAPTGD